MRIAIKKVGEELQIIESNKKYRTETVQEYIGKEYYPEFIYKNREGTLSLGINEDGLRLGLPINFLMAIKSPYWPIQKMVGTAVFLRTKPVDGCGEIYDYEVDDLTDEDIEKIKEDLDEDTQKFLQEHFIDYGMGCAVLERL